MVNSGATGNFMDQDVALSNGFRLVMKLIPYRLFVIDGTTIGDDGEGVIYQIDRLIMKTL